MLRHNMICDSRFCDATLVSHTANAARLYIPATAIAVAEGEGRPHYNIHTTLYRLEVEMHLVGGVSLTNKLLVNSQESAIVTPFIQTCTALPVLLVGPNKSLLILCWKNGL